MSSHVTGAPRSMISLRMFAMNRSSRPRSFSGSSSGLMPSSSRGLLPAGGAEPPDFPRKSDLPRAVTSSSGEPRGAAGGEKRRLPPRDLPRGGLGGRAGKKRNFSGAAALPNLRCWSMRYWLRAEMKPPAGGFAGGFAGGSVEGSVEDEGSNGEAEEAEEDGWRELSALEMVIVVNVFGVLDVFIVFVGFMGFIAFIAFAVFARFMELVEFERL